MKTKSMPSRPSDTTSKSESYAIAALTEEVAQLRTELDQLRQSIATQVVTRSLVVSDYGREVRLGAAGKRWGATIRGEHGPEIDLTVGLSPNHGEHAEAALSLSAGDDRHLVARAVIAERGHEQHDGGRVFVSGPKRTTDISPAWIDLHHEADSRFGYESPGSRVSMHSSSTSADVNVSMPLRGADSAESDMFASLYTNCETSPTTAGVMAMAPGKLEEWGVSTAG